MVWHPCRANAFFWYGTIFLVNCSPVCFILLDLPPAETPAPVRSHSPIPHIHIRKIKPDLLLMQQTGVSTRYHQHPHPQCVAIFRVFRPKIFLDLSSILTLVFYHFLNFFTNLFGSMRANTYDQKSGICPLKLGGDMLPLRPEIQPEQFSVKNIAYK